MAQAIKWKISGDEIVSCNCDWGCPCQFNARPTHGRCEALMACRIREGRFGETSLAGIVFAAVLSWPGAMHEGNGTAQLIIDRNASEQQRQSLLEIFSARHGGAFFEIFHAICPNALEPIFASIDFEYDDKARRGKIRIEGSAEARIEPIHNPATGAEHRARIVLPDGFEFKEAEAANAASIEVSAPKQVAMKHQNTYAHLARIEWGNQAG